MWLARTRRRQRLNHRERVALGLVGQQHVVVQRNTFRVRIDAAAAHISAVVALGRLQRRRIGELRPGDERQDAVIAPLDSRRQRHRVLPVRHMRKREYSAQRRRAREGSTQGRLCVVEEKGCELGGEDEAMRGATTMRLRRVRRAVLAA